MSTKSACIIAGAILLGCLILGLCQRYELIAPTGHSQILLLDKATGHVWLKFQPSNEGPTKWQRIDP